MKALKNIIESINEKLVNLRNMEPDDKYQSFQVINGKYLVDVYINSNNEKEVNIINPQHYMRFYENVCQYIEDHMNDWEDVEVKPYDMWDDHGFRNEADYLQYRYG